MWRKILGSKQSWIKLLIIILIGAILILYSFISHKYNFSPIVNQVILALAAILFLCLNKKKKKNIHNNIDEQIFDDKYTYEEGEKEDILKLLIIYFILLIISLIAIIIITIVNGFNFEYIEIFFCEMLILLRFIVLPSQEKKNAIIATTIRIFDIITYTAICLGILYLINKYYLHII